MSALIEKVIREHGGEKIASMAPVAASQAMASHYGMELHDKVNDALMRAYFGKFAKTREFRALNAAVLLEAFKKSPSLRATKETATKTKLMEKLVAEVAAAIRDGKVSQKGLAIFRSPVPFIQLLVIEAYRRAIHDDGSAPTITEVRLEFLKENKKTLLPKGFAFRKMITKTFGLPLAKAKRGKPHK
jgi:hypothetical protein